MIIRPFSNVLQIIMSWSSDDNEMTIRWSAVDHYMIFRWSTHDQKMIIIWPSVRRPPLNRAEGGNCLSVLPLSNKKGNQRIWTILEIIIWIQSLWTGWTGAGSFAALFKVTKRCPAAAWTLAICRGENWARAPPPVRAAGRGRGSSSWNGADVEKSNFTPWWKGSGPRGRKVYCVAMRRQWSETTSSTHQTKQTKVKRGDPISSIISVIRPARLILSLFSLSCFPSFLKSIQQNTFPLSLQIRIFSCYYPSFPWL